MEWYQSVIFDQKGTVGRVEIAQIHFTVNDLDFRVLLTDGGVIDIDVAFSANDISSVIRAHYILFPFLLKRISLAQTNSKFPHKFYKRICMRIAGVCLMVLLTGLFPYLQIKFGKPGIAFETMVNSSDI